MAKKKGMKLIANNKKAFHDYFIEDTYEAGIALAGTEVKSLRMGKCSIKESFIRVENGEVYIYGMHISPYEKGNIFNKKAYAELRLQTLDGLGQCRLGDMQIFCRFCQIFIPRCRQKIPKLLDFHIIPPFFFRALTIMLILC